MGNIIGFKNLDGMSVQEVEKTLRGMTDSTISRGVSNGDVSKTIIKGLLRKYNTYGMLPESDLQKTIKTSIQVELIRILGIVNSSNIPKLTKVNDSSSNVSEKKTPSDAKNMKDYTFNLKGFHSMSVHTMAQKLVNGYKRGYYDEIAFEGIMSELLILEKEYGINLVLQKEELINITIFEISDEFRRSTKSTLYINSALTAIREIEEKYAKDFCDIGYSMIEIYLKSRCEEIKVVIEKIAAFEKELIILEGMEELFNIDLSILKQSLNDMIENEGNFQEKIFKGWKK